nr:165FR [Ipomoea batatas]
MSPSEISKGETSLVDSTPPIRTVEVVVVRVIGKDNKVLVESHQDLSNGAQFLCKESGPGNCLRRPENPEATATISVGGAATSPTFVWSSSASPVSEAGSLHSPLAQHANDSKPQSRYPKRVFLESLQWLVASDSIKVEPFSLPPGSCCFAFLHFVVQPTKLNWAR